MVYSEDLNSRPPVSACLTLGAAPAAQPCLQLGDSRFGGLPCGGFFRQTGFCSLPAGFAAGASTKLRIVLPRCGSTDHTVRSGCRQAWRRAVGAGPVGEDAVDALDLRGTAEVGGVFGDQIEQFGQQPVVRDGLADAEVDQAEMVLRET